MIQPSILGVLLALALAATNAVAQTYPLRTVRVIVPAPPGGALGSLSR